MIEHLSPSTVQSYRKCGRQLYYRKIMGIPDKTVYAATAYGTAVHRTIETILREVKLGYVMDDDEVISLFQQEMSNLADSITVWGEDNKGHLLEQGEIAVEEFKTIWLPKIVPVEIEKTFNVDRGEGKMPIKCIADCVGDGIIWDWKLGRGFYGTANSADYALNMATYAKAYFDEHGEYPRSIRILRAKWSGKVQPSRKKKWFHQCWEMDELNIPPEAIPYYMSIYDEAERGIKAGIFLPIGEGTGLCKNCSYYHNPCDIHIPEVGKNV